LEILLQKVTAIETDTSGLKSDMNGLKSDVAVLKSDMKELKVEVNKISNKFDDAEAQNANRHLEITTKIDSLTKDLAVLEIVTGMNMMDIGNLKLSK